jgi:hypothetical protein
MGTMDELRATKADLQALGWLQALTTNLFAAKIVIASLRRR